MFAQRARKAIHRTFTGKRALVSWLQAPAFVHDPGVVGIIELLQESEVRHAFTFLRLRGVGVLTNCANLSVLSE